MSITTQWIDITGADGATFPAYLAVPHLGKGPGIVLLQEIFGVNEHIRTVAEQYALDGYVVLVPDLFWREGAHIELGYEGADWQRAVELMQATDNEHVLADITASVAALRARAEVDGKIASIGYCFGGRLSYQAAAAGLVDGAIAYYGGGIQNKLDLAEEIKVPLLMHFGANDSHIPADAVKSIAERFDGREEVEIHVYPQAEHGFNCNYRDSYDLRSSVQAHGNTLIFLSENL
ncbi:dienelactone hydrolase family protein [Janthinobacterium sp. PC23-8]|uniref:dienelactone hydrolase family protein n=1 Tax=Janthinobacterium sp. PC23-8 TaxID=2012679 RepID=UPI000B977645|nr:dienelactone hydrolase family protein [Janthinobacterium sp. PC23-8]OYO32034.1 carboxymethylenebutenolidase [Janthinobacterium sp. PC23-8]